MTYFFSTVKEKFDIVENEWKFWMVMSKYLRKIRWFMNIKANHNNYDPKFNETSMIHEFTVIELSTSFEMTHCFMIFPLYGNKSNSCFWQAVLRQYH